MGDNPATLPPVLVVIWLYHFIWPSAEFPLRRSNQHSDNDYGRWDKKRPVHPTLAFIGSERERAGAPTAAPLTRTPVPPGARPTCRNPWNSHR